MKHLIFIFATVPNLCFAGLDARMLYIKAVEDFSTCGSALMPWGNEAWQPDSAEKSYVLQAEINRVRMQSEIDADFYSQANLKKLFVTLTNNFYEKTANIRAHLKKLPAEEHSLIWSSLFGIEKNARLVRDKLESDFRLHAEIIKMCFDEIKEPLK